MNKNIVEFVSKVSYLEFEEYDSDNHIYSFTTRRNGNIMDCEFSPKDYKEALKTKQLLLEEFSNITVTIDTCDEWVSFYIVETI